MQRLIEAFNDATQDGGTSVRDTVAVLIALLTWLGVSGLIWNAHPGNVAPFVIATVPAVIAYCAAMVITELKGWY